MSFFGYISKSDVHLEAIKWATELLNTANNNFEEGNHKGFVSYYEKSRIIIMFGQKINGWDKWLWCKNTKK